MKAVRVKKKLEVLWVVSLLGVGSGKLSEKPSVPGEMTVFYVLCIYICESFV